MQSTYSEIGSDPDELFARSSVAEVRNIEKRMRSTIEVQKQELRTMVGEQYQDLISAADAIITMSKNAVLVQEKLERMQASCDVSLIREQAILTQSTKEGDVSKTFDQRLYALAALVKSLADVPEQIWHALENHRYLHAGRLYTLSKAVHDYLDTGFDDIYVAFPVIQRQWDAVSVFKPQILSRSLAYLRLPEATSEQVAEILVNLMLLDGLTLHETLQRLLETRMEAIKDMAQPSNNEGGKRLPYHFKEMVQMIRRTLLHIHQVFYGKEEEGGLMKLYIQQMEHNFMLPDSKMPAIVRVFSPSTNVHLLMRYLPESLQNFNPELNPGIALTREDAEQAAQSWLNNVEETLETQLPVMLAHVHTHRTLVELRSKVWDWLDMDEPSRRSSVLDAQESAWQQVCRDLLHKPCSIWESIFRNAFNNHSKLLIDKSCKSIKDQPREVVWPRLAAKTDIFTFGAPGSSLVSLPMTSGLKEMEKFKEILSDVSRDRTPWFRDMQYAFDSALSSMRDDFECHLIFSGKDQFQSKVDIQMLVEYFTADCFRSISEYISGLRGLLPDLKGIDSELADDMAIAIGRLAQSIGLFSKELPKVLTLNRPTSLELRSGIDQDPRYKELQDQFLETFRLGHKPWIDTVSRMFRQSLSEALSKTKWNDECPAILVWESMDDDVQLPVQPSITVTTAVYKLCEEIQRINAGMLDKTIIQPLRQSLASSMMSTLTAFLDGNPNMTEKGATQLTFDMHYLNFILQDGLVTEDVRKCLSRVQEKIDPINWVAFEPHFLPNVERFCLKQTLIVGILIRPSRDTFERSRKIPTTQSQQHNVLPVAPQAPRFTLLPVGHLSGIKAR